MPYISESTVSVRELKPSSTSKHMSRDRERNIHHSHRSDERRRSRRLRDSSEEDDSEPRASREKHRKSHKPSKPLESERVYSFRRTSSGSPQLKPKERYSEEYRPRIRIRRLSNGVTSPRDVYESRRDSDATRHSSGGLRRSETTKTLPRKHVERVPIVRTERSASLRNPNHSRVQTPPLKRSNTTDHGRAAGLRPVSYAGPSSSAMPMRPPSINASGTERKRSSGIFSALFGTPPAASRGQEKQVECLTCLSDDIPISKSAKLGCEHTMCHDCLQRIFKLSISDPQHMPPRCCTQDHIPLRHVDRLFNDKFKMHWNRKYQEYTTKNRIYCPSRGCGEWIRPADIHTELGRKCGRCRRCKTKVCCQCNGKWHTRKECPKDEETNRFVEIAKKEGWQRCHNCSAMIELKEGCNHMTCRCTAEFCMICGSKWKTCNCPWFNYDAVEADRLQHMQIPVARRVPINHPHPHPPPPPPPPPANYADELAGRRRQEVRDEAIARRLQALNLDLDDDGLLHDTNNRRHHHHHHNHPPPHPQPPPGPPLRRHTTASRRYNADPSTRPAERVVPRRTASGTGYAAEADRHRPVVTVAGAGAAQMRAEVRQSRMAGLTREGRAMPGGRVGEWLRHVQPGLAAGEVGVVG